MLTQKIGSKPEKTREKTPKPKPTQIPKFCSGSGIMYSWVPNPRFKPGGFTFRVHFRFYFQISDLFNTKSSLFILSKLFWTEMNQIGT